MLPSSNNETIEERLDAMPMEDFEVLLQQACQTNQQPVPEHAEILKQLKGTREGPGDNATLSNAKYHSSLQSLNNNDPASTSHSHSHPAPPHQNNHHHHHNHHPPTPQESKGHHHHYGHLNHTSTLTTINSTSSLNSVGVDGESTPTSSTSHSFPQSKHPLAYFFNDRDNGSESEPNTPPGVDDSGVVSATINPITTITKSKRRRMKKQNKKKVKAQEEKAKAKELKEILETAQQKIQAERTQSSSSRADVDVDGAMPSTSATAIAQTVAEAAAAGVPPRHQYSSAKIRKKKREVNRRIIVREVIREIPRDEPSRKLSMDNPEDRAIIEKYKAIGAKNLADAEQSIQKLSTKKLRPETKQKLELLSRLCANMTAPFDLDTSNSIPVAQSPPKKRRSMRFCPACPGRPGCCTCGECPTDDMDEEEDFDIARDDPAVLAVYDRAPPLRSSSSSRGYGLSSGGAGGTSDNAVMSGEWNTFSTPVSGDPNNSSSFSPDTGRSITPNNMLSTFSSGSSALRSLSDDRRRLNERPTKKKNSKANVKEVNLDVSTIPGFRGKDTVEDLVQFVEGNSAGSSTVPTAPNSNVKKKTGKKDRGGGGAKTKETLVKSASLDENHLNARKRSSSSGSSPERPSSSSLKEVEKKSEKAVSSHQIQISGTSVTPPTSRPPEASSGGGSVAGAKKTSTNNNTATTSKTNKQQQLPSKDNVAARKERLESKSSLPLRSSDEDPTSSAPFELVTKKKKHNKKTTTQREAESFSRRQAKEQSRREAARSRRGMGMGGMMGGERRTSVCSAPESENSDQSDDDSVRSLPAGECTPREHIPKQCASSGGTPQTSYADIAKAPEPRKLVSPLPPPSPQAIESESQQPQNYASTTKTAPSPVSVPSTTTTTSSKVHEGGANAPTTNPDTKDCLIESHHVPTTAAAVTTVSTASSTTSPLTAPSTPNARAVQHSSTTTTTIGVSTAAGGGATMAAATRTLPSTPPTPTTKNVVQQQQQNSNTNHNQNQRNNLPQGNRNRNQAQNQKNQLIIQSMPQPERPYLSTVIKTSSHHHEASLSSQTNQPKEELKVLIEDTTEFPDISSSMSTLSTKPPFSKKTALNTQTHPRFHNRNTVSTSNSGAIFNSNINNNNNYNENNKKTKKETGEPLVVMDKSVSTDVASPPPPSIISTTIANSSSLSNKDLKDQENKSSRKSNNNRRKNSTATEETQTDSSTVLSLIKEKKVVEEVVREVRPVFVKPIIPNSNRPSVTTTTSATSSAVEEEPSSPSAVAVATTSLGSASDQQMQPQESMSSQQGQSSADTSLVNGDYEDYEHEDERRSRNSASVSSSVGVNDAVVFCRGNVETEIPNQDVGIEFGFNVLENTTYLPWPPQSMQPLEETIYPTPEVEVETNPPPRIRSFSPESPQSAPPVRIPPNPDSPFTTPNPLYPYRNITPIEVSQAPPNTNPCLGPLPEEEAFLSQFPPHIAQNIYNLQYATPASLLYDPKGPPRQQRPPPASLLGNYRGSTPSGDNRDRRPGHGAPYTGGRGQDRDRGGGDRRGGGGVGSYRGRNGGDRMDGRSTSQPSGSINVMTQQQQQQQPPPYSMSMPISLPSPTSAGGLPQQQQVHYGQPQPQQVVRDWNGMMAAAQYHQQHLNLVQSGFHPTRMPQLPNVQTIQPTVHHHQQQQQQQPPQHHHYMNATSLPPMVGVGAGGMPIYAYQPQPHHHTIPVSGAGDEGQNQMQQQQQPIQLSHPLNVPITSGANLTTMTMSPIPMPLMMPHPHYVPMDTTGSNSSSTSGTVVHPSPPVSTTTAAAYSSASGTTTTVPTQSYGNVASTGGNPFIGQVEYGDGGLMMMPPGVESPYLYYPPPNYEVPVPCVEVESWMNGYVQRTYQMEAAGKLTLHRID